MRSTPPAGRLRAHGLVGLVALATVIAVAVAAYLQAFTPVVTVSLVADRAGLLMDQDAEVRLRGVRVGAVRSVEPGADGGAVLQLALDPEMAERVPADATAQIRPATMFGAKNVHLIVPAGPVSSSISEGDRIHTEHVTTEINDIFAGLRGFLTTVEPSQLNATLGALAATLDGRGAQLGTYASQLNTYLSRLNPSLGALRTDIRGTTDVAGLYAKVTPDVADIAENLSTSSRSLTEAEVRLHAFLLELSGTARKGARFLATIQRPLVTSMDTLNPTLRLLARYSPMLTCTIKGLNEARKRLESALGNDLPGIQAVTSFLPGQEGYKYPRDLPKFVTGNGPHCYGLPYVSDAEAPSPRYEFDDGEHVFEGRPGIAPGDPPIEVYEQLLGPLPQGWEPR